MPIELIRLGSIGYEARTSVGRTAVRAHVQFQVDETCSDATSLTIESEASDDALTFTSVTNDITSRLTTADDTAEQL